MCANGLSSVVHYITFKSLFLSYSMPLTDTVYLCAIAPLLSLRSIGVNVCWAHAAACVSDGFTPADTFILWPNGNGIWHKHTLDVHECWGDGLRRATESSQRFTATHTVSHTTHNLTWQRNFWIRDEWKFSRKTSLFRRYTQLLDEMSLERCADDAEENGKKRKIASNY